MSDRAGHEGRRYQTAAAGFKYATLDERLTRREMDVREIGPLGWMHVIFFGLYVPALVIRARWHLSSGTPIPSVRQHFRSGAIAQLLFVTLSLAVASIERIDLFPRRFPQPTGIVAGVITLAVLFASMRRRWRRNVERGLPIVRMFMPRDGVERAQWIALSTLAAVGEEITWRGVQFALLWQLFGSPILSAATCSALFGIVHAVQGWKSTVIFIVIAAAFHVVVWLSGSLYVAMAVHFLYDVAAGINYGRLGRELGYGVGKIESQT
jgi:membrane protease YdiL (CAAX protease family)